MKPQKLALTQDYVDVLTIEPGAPGDVSIYDTERKGLFVRLRRGAGGISKTWYVGYQWRGSDRKLLLGSTAAYTLMDARDRARDVLRDVADGNDPAAAKTKVMKTRPTFAEAAEQFIARRLEAFQSGKIRRNTFRGYVRYLTGPYFEPLHEIELAKIEKAEIVLCINSIRARSKSAGSQARGSLILLYDWAQLQGWIADGVNPARYTENPLPRRDAVPRDRTLRDHELIAVWKAAGDDDYGRIIRLLILLGVRRDEIARMPWDELQNGIWHLPAERTKTGEARRIPLPAAALALIGERPAGRKHVFGTRDLNGFTLWSNDKAKLDERLLGKVDDWTLHDLRRTMRSGLTALGVNRELAEKMIGHIPPKIIRTYEVEEQLGEQAAAFALWANTVAGIVDGTVRRLAAA